MSGLLNLETKVVKVILCVFLRLIEQMHGIEDETARSVYPPKHSYNYSQERCNINYVTENLFSCQ